MISFVEIYPYFFNKDKFRSVYENTPAISCCSTVCTIKVSIKQVTKQTKDKTISLLVTYILQMRDIEGRGAQIDAIKNPEKRQEEVDQN